MNKISGNWREVLVAALAISMGVFAITQTSGMSELGRVFPITASLIAIAAGLGVLAQSITQSRARAIAADQIDYVRAGLFAFTMMLWALLLDRFGFVATSGVAVVVVAVIARREPMSKKSILAHAAAGTVLVMGFSLLLREVLNVKLP